MLFLLYLLLTYFYFTPYHHCLCLSVTDYFLLQRFYFTLMVVRSDKHTVQKWEVQCSKSGSLSLKWNQLWFSHHNQSLHFTLSPWKSWQSLGNMVVLPGDRLVHNLLFGWTGFNHWHTNCPWLSGSVIHLEARSQGAWLRQGWSGSNVIKSHPLSSCIFLMGQQLQVGKSGGSSWSTRMDYLTSYWCHTHFPIDRNIADCWV